MRTISFLLVSCCVMLVLVAGQQPGNNQAESHPQISIQMCTNSSGCQTQQRSIVLDSNWRWVHTSSLTNCYNGNQWDTSICPDPVSCAQKCALDGADYQGTYGIQSSGNAVTLKFVTHGPYSTNIGSRVYLMQDDNNYQLFKLKNKEFTFDVDVSNLPCGLNGALYFVEMPQDGGMKAYSNNKAGAKYGTGYCDAQCPHDIKFINGEANILNWKPSPNDPNAGTGQYGSCCMEMDIWEANKMSTAYTAHVCTVNGQSRCSGTQCGDGTNRYGGVCDKDGCDFNSYRLGVHNFYGSGMSVDTSKPITVVTQFITKDHTNNGDLAEIRRIYVQNGKQIQNSKVSFPNIKAYDSVQDTFCSDLKTLFGDKNDFAQKGGMRAMGQSFDRGMVLVMSLWDDHEARMLWLDSNYPTDQPATKPGVARGTCSTDSGKPTDVESQYPNSSVKFSNVKFGDIGSTFK